MDDVGQAEYATLGPLLLAGCWTGWRGGWNRGTSATREVVGVLLAMRDRSAGIDPVTVLSCAGPAGWPRTGRPRWR